MYKKIEPVSKTGLYSNQRPTTNGSGLVTTKKDNSKAANGNSLSFAEELSKKIAEQTKENQCGIKPPIRKK